MAYETIAELQDTYVGPGDYTVNPAVVNSPSPYGYLEVPRGQGLRQDTYLLEQMLRAPTGSPDHLAEQVFKSQKQQESIVFQHLANLLQERHQLYRQHLQDIDHRHGQIQQELFCVRINKASDSAKRLSNLESQLLQLEGNRREEALAFWKDAAELRDKLFERATSYRAARDRYDILTGVEGADEL